MVDTDKTGEADLGDKPSAPAGTHSTPTAVSTDADQTPPSTPRLQQDPETLNADIAKILKEVTLPERRRSEATADIKAEAQEPLQQVFEQHPETAQTTITTILTPERTEEKQQKKVNPVHTLKDDLQGIVHDQKISLVRAVSLEEDRRTRGKDTPEETLGEEQRSKRTSAIIFSAVLLFVVGGGALWGVYSIARKPPVTPSLQTTSSILFSEKSVTFSLSNRSPRDLKQMFAEARISSAGTLASITRVIPIVATTNPDGAAQDLPATFAEFMRSIGAHIPDDLIRALGSDFFFGIHTVDENAPFIIVPVTSYDHAFAGMLAWEGTLNADLAPAFTAVSPLTVDPNGIPSKRTFQDLIMRNYDVRALKDDTGEIQLYYSFPTQNILVIAESPYSFTEILSRLQAGRNL